MKQLIIKDTIYGTHVIDSPVTIELLRTKNILRLKNILQQGVPNTYYHHPNPFSRYDHSVGVMLVLKKIGASEEEQVAGLLHDISHTAFSHVIDWVVNNHEKEDFQDQQHKRFFIDSQVSTILKKYNYDPDYISDYHHFTLLEQNIPNVCADRIDYSLKEFPLPVAQQIARELISKDGLIAFRSREGAKKYAVEYLKKQMNHWGSFESKARYALFGKALKIGLNKNYLSFNDFWQNDIYVIKKMISKNDLDINNILRILTRKSLLRLPKEKVFTKTKFRYQDPFFLNNGSLVRLSDVDRNFKIKIEKAKKINASGHKLPLI